MAKIKSADVMRAYRDWAHAETTRPPHDQGRLNAGVRFYDARQKFLADHGREWPMPGSKRTKRNPARLGKRGRRASRLIAERDRLARQLEGAPIHRDMSPTIRKLGTLQVKIAHLERRPQRRRRGERSPAQSRRAAHKRNPSATFPIYIKSGSGPWTMVAVARTKAWGIALARRLHKTGLGVKVTD